MLRMFWSTSFVFLLLLPWLSLFFSHSLTTRINLHILTWLHYTSTRHLRIYTNSHTCYTARLHTRHVFPSNPYGYLLSNAFSRIAHTHISTSLRYQLINSRSPHVPIYMRASTHWLKFDDIGIHCLTFKKKICSCSLSLCATTDVGGVRWCEICTYTCLYTRKK